MPKPSKNEEERIRDIIINHRFLDGRGIITQLPDPDDVQDVLNEHFQICDNRNFRVILVEDMNDYKVFIQIPDGKTRCDFRVWRAIFENGIIEDVKVPTHNDLGRMYISLKKQHPIVEEFLINATVKLIRYRWDIDTIIQRYFKDVSEVLKIEIRKFLATLKWIVLQEDTNYPPREQKLGSKYTLAFYALLECGFTLGEIRRVIKF